MRLQKLMSRAGVASRRGSENLITAGRITVNDLVVTELGTKVDPTCDAVALDGRIVKAGGSPTYIMLNKPRGVLTTMSDPHGRPTVADLVASVREPALFPVGRLDRDTSGLLFFTTDGELGDELSHPKYELFKTYEVKVQGKFTAQALKRLEQGIELEDGMTAPAKVHYANGVLILQIREGRNRQVRRMCEAVGFPVVKLHRSRLGSLELGDLQLGKWRHLSDSEILDLTMSLKAAPEVQG